MEIQKLNRGAHFIRSLFSFDFGTSWNHSKQSIQEVFAENNYLILFILENLYGLVLNVCASTYTNYATLAADLLLFYPGYNHGIVKIMFTAVALGPVTC